MDFTVIVPTRNRPAQLAGCLEALFAQHPSAGPFEIIVADDAGAHDLQPVLQPHARNPIPIRLLRLESNAGPGPARNAAAQIAKGRWLAFTDDDCRPRPHWLSSLRPLLAQNDQTLAGGRTVNQLAYNPCAAASQLICDAAYAFFNPHPGQARFLASNNLAAPREHFLKLGGFDPQFRPASEDRDLCDRWLFHGGRLAFTEHALVEHAHNLSPKSFLRQHYNYGRGAALYHRARKLRGSGSLTRDMAFHSNWPQLLLRPAFASPWPLRTLALLAAWQAANTAGFLRQSIACIRETPAEIANAAAP
jgi:GT2 family glycosyltransferase